MDTPPTNRIPARIPAAALIVALAALGAAPGGCVISRARTEYTGSYIAPTTVLQIEPGETKESVLDLLGPPTDKGRLGPSAERWSWHWAKRRRSSERVLLVLSSTSQLVEEKGTVWVEFDQGVVTAAWGG